MMRAGVALALLAAAGASAAQGSANTLTTSTSSSTTFVDTPQVIRLDMFSTRLLGVLDDGATIYDQVFNVAFADPLVQAAILSAQAALVAAGAPSAVTLSGPTLTSSVVTSTGSSTSATVDNTLLTEILTLEDTIGPGTILIGNRDLGGVAFEVLAGTTNLNINTHTATEIFRTITTTTTFLTTSVYTLIGERAGGGGTIPEPGSLALVSLALLAAWKRRASAR
ncbi:MAG: PEP-CTERM sorting domain-containing protein [Rubrivivax sp.]|nr:PEP-CTERM sorting domain-containing protein [Rubrivivax sp.]